ncbi:RluA family pseudouridine synthase [Acinetobacter sp. ESL0695]|uniref:RluA family pseudouridine synthase n=1 Tax=Acinetobacter sp. ESL0695 TaxID=2983215 RepID=UPI0023F476CD|nr:RluA family pseudouridine synthase [Acinetobacter sp. ESL0695]WEV49916.1 RluA family pseudouridine synthase [Acinetobacter sp. ESL0695]
MAVITKEKFIYTPPLGELPVLYEDEYFIAVDKPAGLLSVPGRLPEHHDSAFLRLQHNFQAIKITHRLDMATSGILLFAKHRDAEIAMSKIFQKRAVEKQYIALVQGKLSTSGEVNAPLITDWPNRPKQKIDLAEGKPAQTYYKPLEYNTIKGITRVQLTPITGRSHQLRIHMMHIGHPICGDQFYHPEPHLCEFKRMALHAHKLSFIHPFIEDQELNIISPVPF